MSRAAHWLRGHDTEFQPTDSLPLTDRGFRYGMAVFETIGVRNGRPLFLREHCQRCLEACHTSAFRVREEWLWQACELLRGYINPLDTGVARLHVTAGDGGPGAGANECRMLLSYEPRAIIPPSVYAQGYRLKSCAVPFSPTLDGRKTHNYWPNIIALQAAQAGGADEGLVFNAVGVLASACMANVFVTLAGGRLVTPPLRSGARPGVIRRWVMGVENVHEAALERSDLRQAREIFLTSSWLGVMPASHLDGLALPSATLAGSLMSEYQCLHN